MKKLKSNPKDILTRLGKMSEFLIDLDPHAGKDDCFDFPLEIIRENLLFDVSVLYKVSNIIEDCLILEVVKVFDPDGRRLDLKEGRKLQIFMDNRDGRYLNEVIAFLTRKVSCVNVPGMGSDIIGYVYLPESFGGAYLFGGDFYGKESSIEDYEIAGVEIMCNFLSAILLKTQFERQAEYDNLTGLFNSAKIKFKVNTLLKRFQRKPDSKACIVMGDIDFFKAVNDTHGHIQGDLVLKTMGKILSTSLREAFDM
ncbi:MAG: diguanylate cyclase, partial [Proteobacteria bacterium]|nr:diguanylate cyclase [Pseudomonadota bacterium]